MAFTQSSQVDIIFKKFITNQSTVDNSKQFFEEPYSSRKEVILSDIWLQSDQIPSTAATVSGVVQMITATLSYFAGTKGGFRSSSLTDIIPFNYGDGTSYVYKLYRNNGTTEISQGVGDWLFDNNSGVLTFYSGVSAGNGTVLDGNGVTIVTSSLPPVLRAWRYIGKKGVIPNLSGITYSGGTMSINVGVGLTFSNGQISLSNVLQAGSGLLLNGNTFSSDLGNGLTFSSNKIISDLGNGLTFSSNKIISNIDTNSGLTFSNGVLKISPSLVVASSSVILSTGVIGQYTTDPTSNSNWGVLSIPNRGYVDSVASGLNLKQSVRVAATGSISISSAPSQIDTITMSVGDRVLLWKQDGTTNGTYSNGIYVYNGVGSALTRASDFDGMPASEVMPGSYTFVTDGYTYQGSGFVVVSIGTESSNILVGTQSIKFTQFNSSPSYIWNNGIMLSGSVVDIDLLPSGGLTFSSSKLSISLPLNSGLELSNGGIALSSNISGTGLTFTNGQLSITNPISLGNGLTSSGSTYSVYINSTLTFSSNVLGINSNIYSTGLTFSNNYLLIDIGNGLTFSSNKLQTYLYTGYGLTVSNSIISSSLTAGNGIQIVGDVISTRVNTSTGLYNNSGVNYINWAPILGSGLTWSGSILNTTSSSLQKYSVVSTFTASVANTITHGLGTANFIIQMYDTNGDQIIAQYTNRTSSSIDITLSENTTNATVVIIG